MSSGSVLQAASQSTSQSTSRTAVTAGAHRLGLVTTESATSPSSQTGAQQTEELEVLQQRVQKLLEQNQRLQNEKNHLEGILDGVLKSKSWKLTKPLRALIAACKFLYPLLRFKKFNFNFEPGRHTLKTDSGIQIDGPGPYVHLSPSGGDYPKDWVLVRCLLDSASHDQMFFALYYRGKEDYCEQHRVFLPLADKTSSAHMLRLPPNTQGLRLDPFNTEGSFSFSKFEIQEIGKLQMAFFLFKKHVGPFVTRPAYLLSKTKKLLAILREGGFTALRIRLFANSFTNDYQEWVEKYDTIKDEDRKAIKEHIGDFKLHPKFSIVMPTYNTPEKWLRAAIESVQRQLYPHWELCIVDDNSSLPEVRRILEEYRKKDSRVKLLFREKNGHIAAASNDGLQMAEGEFVVLLDHDDELSEHALYMNALEINRYPESALIYSDEDKLTGYGLRFNPYFKSDWNPELLLSQNYVCHLSVFRRDILKLIGGFRQGVDGAQDWDLILRSSLQMRPDQIRHIPFVLYHWRVIEGSTAQSTSYKPYVLKAQQRSVEDYLKARNIEGAQVEILEDIAQLRVRYAVPNPGPLVSIIIPTRDRVDLLSRDIESIIEKSSYSNFEIIVVDNGSVEPETKSYFSQLAERNQRIGRELVRVIEDRKPFNFSRINNDAVKVARGEILAFLNNDMEVITPDWLSEMVSHVVRAEVGVVGARLLWPNNLLQHGGIILGIGGVAGHNHKGRLRQDPGYFNRAILPQNLSAVTAACVLVRREVFEAVGGFDQDDLSIAFNDVDLCLRIRQKGYLVVYTPYAELYHHESASRGFDNTPEKFLRFEKEINNMKNRWRDTLLNDPYYNPNLTLLSEDFAFSFPPRVKKPWLKENREVLK